MAERTPPDDTTAPVTAEDLVGRVAAALHGTYPADWHGAPAEECTTCQTRARVIVAALPPYESPEDAMI